MTKKKAIPAKPAPAPAKGLTRPAPKAKPVKAAQNASIKGKDNPKPTAPVRKQLSKTERGTDKPLTPAQERFIEEYLIDLNATRSYMAAHPHVKITTANVEGCKLLVNPKVAEKIALLKKERTDRLQLDGDAVVGEILSVGMADARELVEYRFTCCRHCYGKDFKFQRTQGERERDLEKHDEKQDEKAFRALLKDMSYERAVLDEKGGIGYNALKPPVSECPECSGAGVGRVILKDTASFGKRAVALYAGVKEGKDGLEVKMHSKLDALEKIMKHMGLYEADKEQGGMVFVGADRLDDIYKEKMAEKERRAALIKGRAGRLNKAESGGTG